VEYGWNRSIDGTCAPISVLADLGYFTSAYSAFLDIFFALYPIPLIMRLNMPLKSRIAVSIALGLSALACIVSIYKLAIFGQVFEILAVDPTCMPSLLDRQGIRRITNKQSRSSALPRHSRRSRRCHPPNLRFPPSTRPTLPPRQTNSHQ